MTKAEERALEVYPHFTAENMDDVIKARKFFIKGYEQAEKDLTDVAQFSSGPDGFFYGKGYQQAKKDFELTWEDMKRISRILDIMVDDDFKGKIPEECGEEEYYEEVLRRFNSNPKPDSYANEITLEDLQKAAEEIFGKESEFPRKLADDWWQLSPNCYGNDNAYDDFCKFMKTELLNWKAPNGNNI